MLPGFVINEVLTPLSEIEGLCEASVDSISLILRCLAKLKSSSSNPWLVQAAVDLAYTKYIKELDELCQNLTHELEKTEKSLSRKLCHPTATLKQDEPTTALGWYAMSLISQWKRVLRDVERSQNMERFTKDVEQLRQYKMAWMKERGSCG